MELRTFCIIADIKLFVRSVWQTKFLFWSRIQLNILGKGSRLKKVFYLGLVVLVAACATEVPECNKNKNPHVLTSTREFIRLEHSMNNDEQVKLIAKKWCESQNLQSQKTKSYCSGCCITAFQCR